MMNFSTLAKMGAVIATAFCCMSVHAAVNYVADPNPADKVEELSKVTLTFTDASEVDKGSQANNVTITSTGFSKGCTLDYGDAMNQMVITFDKISAEGEYSINIPQDAITADSTPVEAFTITYNVGQEVVDNATLIPAPGEVNWLETIIYHNPDIATSLSKSFGAAPATVTDPQGNISELTPVYDYEIGNGKYRFKVNKLITAPGEYTISFPDKYFSYYNDKSEQIYLPGCEFKYEVKGGTLTEVQSNPSVSEPTSNFNRLTLTFPGYETIKIKEMTYAEKNVSVYMTGKETTMTSLAVAGGDYGFKIEGNSMTYVNQFSDFIEPGHCYMTFPEGCILLGEEEVPCTPFVVEFDIVAPTPANISVTPANGATVSMLNSAVITFPDIASVELGRNPSVNLYRIYEENGQTKTVSLGGAYALYAFERLSDNSFKANFNGIPSVDGDYRITIKSNSFTYEGGYNQDYSVDVKFVAPQAPEYQLTPGNDEALDKIQKFVITFPGQDVVKLNSALSSSNLETKLYAGEEIVLNEYGYIANKQIGSTTEYLEVEGSTNSFSFSLDNAAFDPGKYVLRIPAGIFLMGETPVNFNAAVDVVYECNGEGLDKIKVTPAEPVRSLQNMTVEFINETEISKQTDWTSFNLYRVSEVNSYDDYLEYISGENVYVQGNKLFVDASKPYTEAGRYYFDITKNSLFMSDGTTVSTPQRVYFTVDPNAEASVDIVEDEVTDGRIFTLTGVEVKDMSSPGIYICNGRKYIVR